jgi:zinc finger BED domain-containing protein 1 (E3 SUMO-protein ligase ZBED1)
VRPRVRLRTPIQSDSHRYLALVAASVVCSVRLVIDKPYKMATKSDVWKYFNKTDDKFVRCSICRKDLTYCGSTTNMSRHLSSKHPHVSKSSNSGAQQVKLDNVGFTGVVQSTRLCPAARQEELSQLIAMFIVEDMLPISIVESPALRRLLTYCEPNYMPPCRQTMKARLLKMEGDGRKTLKEQLQLMPSVSITTDIWTSCANDPYMSVTASYISNDWRLQTPILDTVYMTERHTTDVIAESLKKVADEWGITTKIAACVHDGAANCVQAGSRNGWTDVTCAAHTLQLCINNGLGTSEKVSQNPIARTVNAVSRLVGHFSHSPMATQELNKRQLAFSPDKAPRKLIQYTRTRWNSIADMFECLTALRWPVVGVLSDRSVTKASDASTLDLKDEQWQLIAEIVPVLKPLKEATALLSAESTVACTVVYPTLFGLLKFHLTSVPTDSSTLRAFKDTVSIQIKRRFALDQHDSIVNSPIAAATVFDPLQKGLLLFDDSVRSRLYTRLKTEIASLPLPSAPAAATDTGESSSTQPPPSKLSRREQLSLLTCGNSGGPGASNVASDVTTQIDRYLQSPNDDDDDEDVLLYWKAKEHMYPQLAILARKYLAVPATSCASERLFSAAGLIVSDLRSSLLPDTASCLVFLYKNRNM